MTAVEIATGLIDKLRHENQAISETLHAAQDTIKYSERQLAEKNRVIKVLEDRIRAGTDGILEMTNRQKELTIKHLEMQIQKLLKENEDYKVRLEAIKAEICPKCETKLLMNENRENISLSKSYRPPGKSSSTLLGTNPSQTFCPNRVKALERIIEHKDKRIMHLTKEVKRFTQLEDELTKKIYRLTKLLPMSRLPPEGITDCLLKEIQLLESQKQNDGSSEPNTFDVLSKVSKPSSYAFSAKTHPSKSTERFKTSVFSKHKAPTSSLKEFEPVDALDATKFENEVLHKKLQKLCHGINELKHLFAYESESLSHGLNCTANEYRSFKTSLEEIINNLNEIVQNMLTDNIKHKEKYDIGYQSDDNYVISCLQKRLKESAAMITEYENENKALKESLEELKPQTPQQDSFPDYLKKSREKLFKSFSDTNCPSSITDTKKLQEIIIDKETQLEAAKSHINTCQKLIEELQKHQKQCRLSHSPANIDVKTVDNSLEQENKSLKTKLNVSEKNIKTCETVIEQLQKKSRHLEEENEKLESELHEYKSKAISEESDMNDAIFSKSSEIHTLKKLNQELQDKIKSLEETIKKLQADVNSEKSKNVTADALAQENLRLQSKLDAAEKQINTLEKSIEILQKELKTNKDEKNKYRTQFEELLQKNNLAEAYEDDVMALKNDLILKEDEIQDLKEKLHNLESKALEINHYKKSLYENLENLSKTEKKDGEEENSESRKAIYKAAALRLAQELLQLDDDYNLKSDDLSTSSALDEMTRQTRIYLTEVSRLHELIMLKEQKERERFKEYMYEDDDLKLSSPHIFETQVQGEPVDDNLQSFPNLNILKSPDLPSSEKEAKTASDENLKLESAAIALELQNVKKQLDETNSVSTYLLKSCARLEDLLSKEKTERVKSEKELEVCQEVIKDLKTQLNSKDYMAKRLNNLIEFMRSKEFNDEISLEQLKNEIQWLAEKATTTETALCQYKEENSKIKIELNSMKRELMNEKYEKAKTNSELKRLKMQILNSQITLDDIPTT